MIQLTLGPYLDNDKLPDQLIPHLLQRFSSSQAYELYPDVLPLFRSLRQMKQPDARTSHNPKLIVGITTNSDHRVPSILSSFGLDVSPLRSIQSLADAEIHKESAGIRDIDFTILSYDVGFEKPRKEIFDVAKHVGNRCLGENDNVRYIHVGDDPDKDFRAAASAGWEAVLLDREGNDALESSISSLNDLQHLVDLT